MKRMIPFNQREVDNMVRSERKRPVVFRTEGGHVIFMHPSVCCMESRSSDMCVIHVGGKILPVQEDPGSAIGELESAMNGEGTVADRLRKLGFSVAVSEKEGEGEKRPDRKNNETGGAD